MRLIRLVKFTITILRPSILLMRRRGQAACEHFARDQYSPSSATVPTRISVAGMIRHRRPSAKEVVRGEAEIAHLHFILTSELSQQDCTAPATPRRTFALYSRERTGSGCGYWRLRTSPAIMNLLACMMSCHAMRLLIDSPLFLTFAIIFRFTNHRSQVTFAARPHLPDRCLVANDVKSPFFRFVDHESRRLNVLRQRAIANQSPGIIFASRWRHQTNHCRQIERAIPFIELVSFSISTPKSVNFTRQKVPAYQIVFIVPASQRLIELR